MLTFVKGNYQVRSGPDLSGFTPLEVFRTSDRVHMSRIYIINSQVKKNWLSSKATVVIQYFNREETHNTAFEGL